MLQLCLYIQTYLNILLAIFFVSIDSLLSVKYVRHSLSPARLSQPHTHVDGVSLLTCSALCSITESCFGVSFHREKSRCELLSKTEYFGEYLLTDNDGWRVYSNVMGKSSIDSFFFWRFLANPTRCTAIYTRSGYFRRIPAGVRRPG